MIKLLEILSEAESNKCPIPTQNIELNLQNRQKAINEYGYGPLNPNEPNEKFWQAKADMWQLDTVEEAKTSRCGNCVAFDISPRMEDCMPGPISDDDGKLGYCWMHSFKCHSARTCRTWAKGGPIEKDSVSYEWQERKGE